MMVTRPSWSISRTTYHQDQPWRVADKRESCSSRPCFPFAEGQLPRAARTLATLTRVQLLSATICGTSAKCPSMRTVYR